MFMLVLDAAAAVAQPETATKTFNPWHLLLQLVLEGGNCNIKHQESAP